MKKVVAFCPADAGNQTLFEGLQNSLRKFHTEEELPLIRYDLSDVADPMKWYKATPMLAKELLKEYEVVIKLDADQIITGSLSHLWETDDFDIACVNNGNPREMQTYPVGIWDIHPLEYLNCGLVVMRDAKLVEHWWNLCNSSHFEHYQMKEQDLLNILCFYGDYRVLLLDSSTKWHGLITKGYWPQIELEGDKLVLKKNEEWPTDADKEIVVIHFAGGNDPNKGNLRVHFSDEVRKKLEWLIR